MNHLLILLAAGLFSVSSTEQVEFAPANLQYDVTTMTWSFAEHQYDEPLGASGDVIDVFGWACSGYHDPDDAGNIHYLPTDNATGVTGNEDNPTGYGPSAIDGVPCDLYTLRGEKYANYDWGRYCSIVGYMLGSFRTLSREEWDYLFTGRDSADYLSTQTAGIDDVWGVVLMPDNMNELWDPEKWEDWKLAVDEGSYDMTYTAEEWTEMEELGCIFLPQYPNGYWSSSCIMDNPIAASYMNFNEWGAVTTEGTIERYKKCAVRLVKTTRPVPTHVESATSSLLPVKCIVRQQVLIRQHGQLINLLGQIVSKE